MSRVWIDVAYLVASICLIIGIKRLSHPRTARSGNLIAAAGMVIAVGFTFAIKEIDSYGLIVLGIAIGTVIGVVSARMVRMTAMPQMVALFNGVGGGAAALIAAAEYHRTASDPGQLPGSPGASAPGARIHLDCDPSSPPDRKLPGQSASP